MTRANTMLLSAVLTLLLTSVATSRGELARSSVDLSVPVTFAAESVPIDVLFRVTEALAGIKVLIDPELEQAWRSDEDALPLKISASFEGLEAKYVLAWLTHFAHAKAAIRDGTVHVFPSARKEEGDPIFNCFKETDGPWREALIRRVNSKEEELAVTLDDVQVCDAVRMILRISNFNLLDPELARDSAAMSAKWNIDYEGTSTGCIDFIARKAGFVWRFQGGTVFMTTNGVPTAEQFSYDGDTVRLDLRKSGVSDMSFLNGAPLTELLLGGTKLTDISQLKGMPLVRLDLSDTAVTNLSPLKGMTINTLNLSRTPLRELQQVRKIVVEHLMIDGTAVSDLTPLRGMRLKLLHLANTKVTDLTPLRGMPLTALSLFGTQVSDLRPLKRVPLSSSLWISETPVTDLSPLKGKDIWHVEFTPARITSGIEVLRKMPGLTCVNGLDVKEFWKLYDAGEFQKEATTEKNRGDGSKPVP